jgi:hypothetical protein
MQCSQERAEDKKASIIAGLIYVLILKLLAKYTFHYPEEDNRKACTYR